MRVSHSNKSNTQKPAIDRLFDEIIAAYVKEVERSGYGEALAPEINKRVSKWKIRLGMIKSCQKRKEVRLMK